jgi:hypothetical protein
VSISPGREVDQFQLPLQRVTFCGSVAKICDQQNPASRSANT